LSNNVYQGIDLNNQIYEKCVDYEIINKEYNNVDL